MPLTRGPTLKRTLPRNFIPPRLRRVVSHAGGIGKAGANVGGFNIWIVTNDFRLARAACQHIQNIGNSQLRSGHNRSPATDASVSRYTGEASDRHSRKLIAKIEGRKPVCSTR